jgi:hypothetical protein
MKCTITRCHAESKGVVFQAASGCGFRGRGVKKRSFVYPACPEKKIDRINGSGVQACGRGRAAGTRDEGRLGGGASCDRDGDAVVADSGALEGRALRVVVVARARSAGAGVFS